MVLTHGEHPKEIGETFARYLVRGLGKVHEHGSAVDRYWGERPAD